MYSQASQYMHAATDVEEMTECDDRIECMLNHIQRLSASSTLAERDEAETAPCRVHQLTH